MYNKSMQPTAKYNCSLQRDSAAADLNSYTSVTAKFTLSILFFVLFAVKSLAESSVEITFDIHPSVTEAECSDLIDDVDHQIYSQLKEANRIKIIDYSFDERRKYKPCIQTVTVIFENGEDYYNHLNKEFYYCVSYSFFGTGADYEYGLAIVERTLYFEDKRAFDILSSKPTRCVNEQIRDIYGRLNEGWKKASK